MNKIRVFELAKEYGLKGPELADMLRNLGFDQIKTHMAALDDAQLMQIEARLAAHGLSRNAAPESAPVSTPARVGGLRKKALPPAVPAKDKEPQRKRLPGQDSPGQEREVAAPEPTPAARPLPQRTPPQKALPGAPRRIVAADGTAMETEPMQVADRAAEPTTERKPSTPPATAETSAKAAQTTSEPAPKAAEKVPGKLAQPNAEAAAKESPAPGEQAKTGRVDEDHPAPAAGIPEPGTAKAGTEKTVAKTAPQPSDTASAGRGQEAEVPATARPASPAADDKEPASRPVGAGPAPAKSPEADAPAGAPTGGAVGGDVAAASGPTGPQDQQDQKAATPTPQGPTGPHVKRLLVPQAKAQVLRRIELPQETIRDATRRSAPAADRGPAGAAGRDLRARALQNTQIRNATGNRPAAPGQRRGPSMQQHRGGPRIGGRRQGPRMTSTVDPNKIVELTPPVSIKGLSEAFGIKVNELLATLNFRLGIKGKNINSFLNQEEVELVAMEAGRAINIVERREAEEQLLQTLVDETATEETYTRAPVVTFMGHVDHGKTSLLDALRASDVVEGEAGGITQHIGAYKIHSATGHSIVVLDTPGHAAFTAMRARGASITDIVVLVVAADDGVMPQTEEAIAHAREAKVPIVVALTKCDKPQANPMQVKQQLMVKGLQAEEWGGTTQMAEVSATEGTGLDNLIERIMLEAELLDLRAAPSAPATGVVVESKQTPEQGITVNVLVTNGTLRVKDHILCGDSLSRVRGIMDDKGQMVQEAGPSTPVQLFGISKLPQPGDKLYAITDVKKAKEVAEERQRRARDVSLAERTTATVTLENLSQTLAAQKIAEFKVILKADVMGSLEPIKRSLEEQSNNEVKVNIIHTALGGITETDVSLAEASKAVIIGFNSTPDASARQAADRAGVEIRYYDVIYALIDDIRLALEGMLAPEQVENVVGHAEIRAVFKSSRAGNIAGCYVLDGVVHRNSKVRLNRGKQLVHAGSIASLKRMKDDVREVRAGYECGILLNNFDDFKEGDILEFFEISLVKRTLK